MPDKAPNTKETNKAANQRQHRADPPARQSPVASTELSSPLDLQRAIADPGAASPRDILTLQRLAGNRAVARLIQAKLTVGPAGDKYEQEADRVADQVLNTRSPSPLRRGVGGEVQRQAEDEEEVQTKPLAASITPLVQRQPEEEEEVQTFPSPAGRWGRGEGEVQRQPEEEEEVQTFPSPGGRWGRGEGEVQRQAEEEEEVQTFPSPAGRGGRGEGEVQRQAEEEEKEEEVQTKPNLPWPAWRSQDGQSPISNPLAGFEAGPDVESRLAASRGGGSPLPDDLRATMEPRFGADFGGVRIHTGGEADHLNRQLSAQAFTRGHDIYMAAGKYAPGTSAGDRLLAHELTHVVQQCPETGQTGSLLVQRAIGYTQDPEFRRRLANRRGAMLGKEEQEEARTAIVNAKAHTRVVAGPFAGDADQRARQINKSPMRTLYNKGDIVPIADDTFHVKDKKGDVIWYRVKKGTANEYIRAEKVFLGAKPGTQGPGQEGDSFSPVSWGGDVLSATDDRLVDALRSLTAKDEKGEEYSEKTYSNVSYAEGAFWAGAGLLGMVTALKDVANDEKSAWEKVQAAFSAIASGEGVLGGVTQIVSGVTKGTTSDVMTSTSAFALGFQEFFSMLANLVKTAKSGVDMIKMAAEGVREGKRHGRNEWLQTGSSLLQGALEVLKGAAKTGRAINEALGGAVTGAASQALSGIALGFDIAIAAVKSVFQGYYLGTSAWQWWLMSQRKKEIKGELGQKYTKEDVKEARGAYRHGEAMKVTLDQLIAKNEKAIAAKQDEIVNMSTKGPQWLLKRRLAKVKTLQDEIAALEKQNADYKKQKAEKENQMQAREAIKELTIVEVDSGAKMTVPGMPTRAELAEVELVSELGLANRKRVVRQAIHIGANLVQIAGSIAAFVSGPGAPAAISLKAAASGVELSLPFFRAIKQFGRNQAAKNLATTGKKGIAGRIFNADKSTAAKLQSRQKQAVLILMMVADLNKLIPKMPPKPTAARLDPLKKQMARVEGYIRATGCDPEKLYRANGKPQEQVKILAAELSKREFGE
jgi:hypothetical protein